MASQTTRHLLMVFAATAAALVVSALHPTSGKAAPAAGVRAVGATAPSVRRGGPSCYINAYEHCTHSGQCCQGYCKRIMWLMRFMCYPHVRK